MGIYGETRWLDKTSDGFFETENGKKLTTIFTDW